MHLYYFPMSYRDSGGRSIVVSRCCKQELVAVFFWSNTYFADQIFVNSPTVLSDVSSKLLIFGECSSKASLPQINIPTLPTDPFQDRRRCQGPCSCMGGQRQGENNSGLNLTTVVVDNEVNLKLENCYAQLFLVGD